MESVCPETVTSLLASGQTYKAISQELKSLYPLTKNIMQDSVPNVICEFHTILVNISITVSI